jgi:methionine aminopeptidase
MRAAGKLASKVLQHAGSMLKAGMTTNDIDVIVHEMTIAAGEPNRPPCTPTDEVMPLPNVLTKAPSHRFV